jgi:hypothetical protein
VQTVLDATPIAKMRLCSSVVDMIVDFRHFVASPAVLSFDPQIEKTPLSRQNRAANTVNMPINAHATPPRADLIFTPQSQPPFDEHALFDALMI